MELGDTLAVVNLAGLVILAFIGWTAIKAVKQHLTDLMNRDLAEVRRQMRTSMSALDRVRDQVTDNREDINKIEVNIVSMQDELEKMSRKLDDFLHDQTESGEEEVEEGDESGDEDIAVPKHLYE
jgi:septal ring factor EnvC (AmiA/AmiB activator)